MMRTTDTGALFLPRVSLVLQAALETRQALTPSQRSSTVTRSSVTAASAVCSVVVNCTAHFSTAAQGQLCC